MQEKNLGSKTTSKSAALASSSASTQLLNILPAPWAATEEEIRLAYDTHENGLADEAIVARRRQFGSNILPGRTRLGTVSLLARQFKSPLVFMLIGAAVLTIILGHIADTVVILLAVIVNVGLGFYQEYKANTIIEKLTAYTKERIRVHRNGRTFEIDSTDLVLGDLMFLTAGDRVPADARLLTLNNLSVDEAILTGESLPISKKIEPCSKGAPIVERKNMVFAGSLIVDGYASTIVTSVGGNTEIGRIAHLSLDSRRAIRPLEKSLRNIAWIIFIVTILIVVAVFALGISSGQPVLYMLLLSVAVAVGAVPEALPIVLTVTLSTGARYIAAHQGILRSLAAAETLGSTTLVMTDKTGTLTEAQMTVVDILTAADLHAAAKKSTLEVQENPAETIPSSSITLDPKLFSAAQKKVLTAAVIATDVVIENSDDPLEKWRFVGRPLESNIVRVAASAGIAVTKLLTDTRPALPFNSTNKFSVAHDAEKHRGIALGAPDILLARTKMSKDDYVAIETWINELSRQGKRLLGVAMLPPETDKKIEKGTLIASDVVDLEFMGLLVLKDPLRVDARSAVEHIQSYGVEVVMVTGDLKGTAAAVASELGWNVHEGNIITGEELRALSDTELSPRMSEIKIYSRVTPEDKMRIGTLYRRLGHVVAMTGDGVNDAPALRAMDIGIALGSGSDVAKSAADLILLDDKFKTIVLAIEEGRRIMANIRKSFVYLMSNSFDEVFLIGGSLLLGLPLPLTAMQIIWVNFFTGSLPALSYAFEKNQDMSLKRTSGSGIFNHEVKVLTFGLGIASSVFLLFFYWFILRQGMAVDEAKTLLFIAFASYILVISFSLKSLSRGLFSYKIFDNRFLNLSVLFAGLAIVASLVIPGLRKILGISTLEWKHLWIIIVWLVFNLVIVELVKYLSRIKIKSHAKKHEK